MHDDACGRVDAFVFGLFLNPSGSQYMYMSCCRVACTNRIEEPAATIGRLFVKVEAWVGTDTPPVHGRVKKNIWMTKS